MILKEEVARRTVAGSIVTVITTTELVRDPGPLYRVSDTVNGVIEERTATPEEEQVLIDWEAEQVLVGNEADSNTKLDTWAYVLRGWATDAESVYSQWDAATQVQKDAWVKETVNRLGKLSDHLADLLVVLQLKRDV
jgi:hypothetical protein